MVARHGDAGDGGQNLIREYWKDAVDGEDDDWDYCPLDATQGRSRQGYQGLRWWSRRVKAQNYKNFPLQKKNIYRKLIHVY